MALSEESMFDLAITTRRGLRCPKQGDCNEERTYLFSSTIREATDPRNTECVRVASVPANKAL